MKRILLISLSIVSLTACGQNRTAGSSNENASASTLPSSSTNNQAMQEVQAQMLAVQNEQLAVHAQIAILQSQGLSLSSANALDLSNFSNLVSGLEGKIQDLINQLQAQLVALDPNDPNAQSLINDLNNSLANLGNLQTQLTDLVTTVKADVQNFFDKINAVVAKLPSPLNTIAAGFLSTIEQKVLAALAKL